MSQPLIASRRLSGAPIDLGPKGGAAALEGTRLREEDVQRQLFLSPGEGGGFMEKTGGNRGKQLRTGKSWKK